MDLANRLSNRMLFAVPKKGRLHSSCLDLLQGSDIRFKRETRLDIALVGNLPMALVFLPAGDIPTFVSEGKVDLGITGQDQVAEHDARLPPGEKSGVEEVMNLGFGRCKLQVQVPKEGPLQTAQDLIGKNIATSFRGLTEDYFTRLESQQSNGVDSSAPRGKTMVRYVGGSVEASCALGVADGIVDLVESGETMTAAGLKAIDTVLESSAVLIKSRTASNETLVNLIASRIQGVITAQKYVLCQYNVPRANLEEATKITPGKRAATIATLDDPDWVAVSAMVEKSNTATIMDSLTAAGASDVLISAIINSRGV